MWLDDAPTAVVRIDPTTGELDYLSPPGEEMFGLPAAEAVATAGFLRGRHADGDGAAAYDAALGRAKQGAAGPPYQAPMRTRTGDAVLCSVTLYPLAGERGRLGAIEGTVVDVSAVCEARARIVSDGRLVTLGALVAGISHEINNPAAFILLGLDMLDRLLVGSGVSLDHATAGSVRALGAELRESVRRIVDVTRALRLFGSPSEASDGRLAPVDVNSTIEGALALTRGKIVERARLERHLDDVPPVLLPDGRLGQVLVNLLLNAAQAIPAALTGDAHAITVSTRSDGRVVEIEVRDTGASIPVEDLARIWQPVSPTKPSEVGIGLGLSVCRDIVERAGGVITAKSPCPGSDPPCGSSFVVVLPAAGADVEPPADSKPPSGRPHNRARVLLVDDEPALASVLAEELGRVYEVVTASSAVAALELLAQGSFDAVLCDLRMPGMSGEALWKEVRRRDEALSLSFVFMTGGGLGDDVERFLEGAARPVLEKPFTTDAALATLAKVLRRGAR